MTKLIPIFVLVVVPIILTLKDNGSNGTPNENEKKVLLEQLRNRLDSKFKEDLTKQDFYLLRFLEAKNYDLDKAELMLRNHLQFREDNKMDGIHNEDWSDMERDYPYRIEGLDKLGRPILQLDFGKWDINKAMDEGKQGRLLRYYVKMVDEVTNKVLELRSQGKNVTQWVCLGNMKDASVGKHSPNAKLNSELLEWNRMFKEFFNAGGRFYYDAANSLENHFPKMSSHLLLLNSPGLFEPVMTVVRTMISDETNEHLKGFSDPKDWKPVVDGLIDPDQLPPEYGGTKGTKTKPLVHGGFVRKEDGSWWFWKGYH